MNKIKFTRIAGWIAVVVGVGAIFQGLGLVLLGLNIQKTIGSIGALPGNQLAILLGGWALINFGQLFVGIKILKGKEKARRTALTYQLFYAVFMEVFNIFLVPDNQFITNFGFLGVLILPALISLLIYLGRKEELPSSFRVG